MNDLKKCFCCKAFNRYWLSESWVSGFWDFRNILNPSIRVRFCNLLGISVFFKILGIFEKSFFMPEKVVRRLRMRLSPKMVISGEPLNSPTFSNIFYNKSNDLGIPDFNVIFYGPDCGSIITANIISLLESLVFKLKVYMVVYKKSKNFKLNICLGIARRFI